MMNVETVETVSTKIANGLKLTNRLKLATLALMSVIALSACDDASHANPTKHTDNNSTDVNTNPPKGVTIRIATEGAYPPFNHTNADGSLGGFDVDVANAMCQQMQANCDIVAQDWDGLIPGLLAKKYDAIIAGMSVTPERQQRLDFTQPYFTNTMVWMAAKDKGFDVNNINGFNLGGQRSTTPGAYLLEHYDGKNGNQVNLYDSYENAYLDLASGRSDAVLAEKVSAQTWLKDNAHFTIVGDEIDNNDNIAVAVRQADALKEEFNKALTELKNNGKLAQLEQQHFAQ